MNPPDNHLQLVYTNHDSVCNGMGRLDGPTNSCRTAKNSLSSYVLTKRLIRNTNPK